MTLSSSCLCQSYADNSHPVVRSIEEILCDFENICIFDDSLLLEMPYDLYGTFTSFSSFPYLQMLFHLLLFSTATHTLASTDSYQEILLRNLFSDVESKLETFIDFENLIRNVNSPRRCQLQFASDQLQRMVLFNVRLDGSLHIEFMPASVEHLELELCDLMCSVDTRRLPRNGVHIALPRNKIFGSIDLSSLPVVTEVFNAARNQIMGRINLLHLSDSLKTLDLGRNKFTQRVVYYTDLPKNVEKIYLRNYDIRQVFSLTGFQKGACVRFDVDTYPKPQGRKPIENLKYNTKNKIKDTTEHGIW